MKDKPRQSVRNILTHQDDTLLAMAAIENRIGDSWLTQQLEAIEVIRGYDLAYLSQRNDDGIQIKIAYTIAEALIECAPGRPDWADDETWEGMQRGIACIVYGDGGWNRWGVRYNGEVLFSEYHTRSGDLEKVEAAGFKTW